MSSPVLVFDVNLRGGLFSICQQIRKFEQVTGSAVHTCFPSNLYESAPFDPYDPARNRERMRMELSFANAGLAALFKLGYTPDALNPCVVSNG